MNRYVKKNNKKKQDIPLAVKTSQAYIISLLRSSYREKYDKCTNQDLAEWYNRIQARLWGFDEIKAGSISAWELGTDRMNLEHVVGMMQLIQGNEFPFGEDTVHLEKKDIDKMLASVDEALKPLYTGRVKLPDDKSFELQTIFSKTFNKSSFHLFKLPKAVKTATSLIRDIRELCSSDLVINNTSPALPDTYEDFFAIYKRILPKLVEFEQLLPFAYQDIFEKLMRGLTSNITQINPMTEINQLNNSISLLFGAFKKLSPQKKAKAISFHKKENKLNTLLLLLFCQDYQENPKIWNDFFKKRFSKIPGINIDQVLNDFSKSFENPPSNDIVFAFKSSDFDMRDPHI